MIGLILSIQAFACNINTADVKELSELKGVGVKTAEKIVQYRKEHKFKTTDELMKVKGIGQKKYDSIKKELSV
jgi:competence protein ComEA